MMMATNSLLSNDGINVDLLLLLLHVVKYSHAISAAWKSGFYECFFKAEKFGIWNYSGPDSETENIQRIRRRKTF